MAIRRAGASPPAGPTVLIGFAEAMAAVETTWSLQQAGFKVAAFCRSGSRSALNFVRGVDIYEIPPPELDAKAAVSAVGELCELTQAAVALPLDDHALWVCSRLEGTDTPVAGPSGSSADIALDKGRQLAAASEAGFLAPETRIVEDPSALIAEQFPIMIKPSRALYELDGVLVRPTGIVCANSDELERARAKRWPGPVLVQPLIRGVGEGLFGHVGQHGVVAWSAHRRVRMVNPQGSASSACRSIGVDDLLIEPAESFLAAIGWTGMFMLEFLRDSDGNPWFMELNGRSWGSMALARRRGFEYPAWAVRAVLEPGFDPAWPKQPPDLVCRNLGLELVHVLFVARGPQSDALMEWPRLGSTIRAICSWGPRHRLYNWNRSQPAVLLADTAGTLARYARKTMRASR